MPDKYNIALHWNELKIPYTEHEGQDKFRGWETFTEKFQVLFTNYRLSFSQLWREGKKQWCMNIRMDKEDSVCKILSAQLLWDHIIIPSSRNFVKIYSLENNLNHLCLFFPENQKDDLKLVRLATHNYIVT